MEPAEFLVHGAAAVADGGHEDVAAEQLAAAETARAVAAVGIDRDGAALERDGDGFARPGIDHIFVNAAHDGDAKRLFLRTLRVARQGGDIGRVIHHLWAQWVRSVGPRAAGDVLEDFLYFVTKGDAEGAIALFDTNTDEFVSRLVDV